MTLNANHDKFSSDLAAHVSVTDIVWLALAIAVCAVFILANIYN